MMASSNISEAKDLTLFKETMDTSTHVIMNNKHQILQTTFQGKAQILSQLTAGGIAKPRGIGKRKDLRTCPEGEDWTLEERCREE